MDDKIDLYMLTCNLLAKFPYELKNKSGNCMDCTHSIRRNTVEEYCIKSIKEFLLFLNFVLGSSSEYHSCIYSFYKANQLTKEEHEQLDKLANKTEKKTKLPYEKLNLHFATNDDFLLCSI